MKKEKRLSAAQSELVPFSRLRVIFQRIDASEPSVWSWALIISLFVVVLAVGKVTFQLSLLKISLMVVLSDLLLILFTAWFTLQFLRLPSKSRVDLVGGAQSLQQHRTTISLPLIVYGAYVGTGGISALLAGGGWGTIQWFGMRVPILVFILVLSHTLRTYRSRRRIMTGCSILLLTLSLIGIFEFAGLFRAFGAQGRRIVGTLGNANYYGAVLVALLPITWADIRYKLKGIGANARKAAIPITGLFTGIFAVFLTLSRAAWAGSVVALGTAIVLPAIANAFSRQSTESSSRSNRAIPGGITQGQHRPVGPRHKLPRVSKRAIWLVSTILVAALLIAVLLLIVFDFFSDDVRARLEKVFSPEQLDLANLLHNRLPLWWTARQIWTGNRLGGLIFGAGPGAFERLSYSTFPPTGRLIVGYSTFHHAHNEYLNILAETGIVGLLFWVALLALGDRGAVYLLSRARYRVAGAALLGAMLAPAITGAVGTPVGQPVAQMLLALSASAAWLLTSRFDRREGQRSDRRTAFVNSIVGVLLLSTLIPLSINVYSLFRSDYAHIRALGRYTPEAPGKNRSPDAWLDESIRWMPGNVRAQYEKLHVQNREASPAALATAYDIERIIPDYRDTILIRGVTYTRFGNYLRASEDLERFISRDPYTKPEAYVHLTAAYIEREMLDQASDTLKRFFLKRHEAGLARSAPNIHPMPYDLQIVEGSREIRTTAATESARTDDDGTGGGRTTDEHTNGDRSNRTIAFIGTSYLDEIVRSLHDHRDMGYGSLVTNLYINIGRIYDSLDYSDECLFYYMYAARSGKLAIETVRSIDEKVDYFARRLEPVFEPGPSESNDELMTGSIPNVKSGAVRSAANKLLNTYIEYREELRRLYPISESGK